MREHMGSGFSAHFLEDLANQTLEGELAAEQLRGLLVLANLPARRQCGASACSAASEYMQHRVRVYAAPALT